MGRKVRAFVIFAAVCGALLAVPFAGPAQAATYTRIKTTINEKCVGISNFGKGNEVLTEKCSSYAQVYWLVDPLASPYVRLRSADPDAWNKCVDASRGNALQLIVVRCDGSAAQAWKKRFIPYSTDYFTLESARYPGLCADVKDVGASDVIQLWQCHGKGNQVWVYW